MNTELFNLSILGPAMVAGLLVLLTHVPLGIQVLSRGIVFIDLAIAQVATLGVIAADRMGAEPSSWKAQLAALMAALLGSVLLTWSERRWPDVQEALIGVLFALASCAAMIMVANDPHGGEHMQDLLAGQILWVSYPGLIPILLASIFMLVIWMWRRQRLGRLLFYILFAVAVTESVQLVGVYLVFASLIVPALATRNQLKQRTLAAYIVGLAGYGAGLLLSTVLDLPAGPVIVWCLAMMGVVWAGVLRLKRCKFGKRTNSIVEAS